MLAHLVQRWTRYHASASQTSSHVSKRAKRRVFGRDEAGQAARPLPPERNLIGVGMESFSAEDTEGLGGGGRRVRSSPPMQNLLCAFWRTFNIHSSESHSILIRCRRDSYIFYVYFCALLDLLLYAHVNLTGFLFSCSLDLNDTPLFNSHV